MIIYTPCYNEMPWTPYFLRHLLDFDCPIIISEGASESRQKDSDRSWDGSYDLIKIFQERWKDRVTVHLHDYSLNTHGPDRQSQTWPRGSVKHAVWEKAAEGEWILGLATDNIYKKIDIPKIKQACKNAQADDYLLMTGQRVFNFNFHTIATGAITGLCGIWTSFWPCIWRKNNEYVLTPGNELLRNVHNQEYLVTGKTQELAQNWNYKQKHVIFLSEVKQFHYKNVKKHSNRVQRFGSERKTSTFNNYSLTGPHLKSFTGSHPSVLNTHPWRHVEDCRKEKPEFDWHDYIDMVTHV